MQDAWRVSTRDFLLAFGRSRIYTHLRPTEHDFSPRGPSAHKHPSRSLHWLAMLSAILNAAASASGRHCQSSFWTISLTRSRVSSSPHPAGVEQMKTTQATGSSLIPCSSLLADASFRRRSVDLLRSRLFPHLKYLSEAFRCATPACGPSLIQIVAGTDQDRHPKGDHPLDEGRLALRHPIGGVDRRVIQEGFPERLCHGHVIPDSDGG